MINIIKKIYNTILIFAVGVADLLLFGIVGVVSVNVFMRIIANKGLQFGEELPSFVLLPGYVAIAIIIGMKENAHINLDIIPGKVPKYWYLAPVIFIGLFLVLFLLSVITHITALLVIGVLFLLILVTVMMVFGMHFAFKKFPKITGWTLHVLKYGCIIIVGALLVYYGIALSIFFRKSELSSLGWPNSIQFVFFPLGGILLVIGGFLKMFRFEKEDDHLKSFITGFYKGDVEETDEEPLIKPYDGTNGDVGKDKKEHNV